MFELGIVIGKFLRFRFFFCLFFVVCEDCLDNVSLTLSFAPREKRACANLILKDNEIAEMVKSFPIFLERTHDLDANVKVDPFIGELIIFDDDGS